MYGTVLCIARLTFCVIITVSRSKGSTVSALALSKANFVSRNIGLNWISPLPYFQPSIQYKGNEEPVGFIYALSGPLHSKDFTEVDWVGVCGLYHPFLQSFLVAFCSQRFQEIKHVHFSCPLRKRHFKSEFALLQTLSLLFHLVQFVNSWQNVLELNSKGLHQSSGKEKERNVQKSLMHLQSKMLFS